MQDALLSMTVSCEPHILGTPKALNPLPRIDLLPNNLTTCLTATALMRRRCLMWGLAFNPLTPTFRQPVIARSRRRRGNLGGGGEIASSPSHNSASTPLIPHSWGKNRRVGGHPQTLGPPQADTLFCHSRGGGNPVVKRVERNETADTVSRLSFNPFDPPFLGGSVGA